MARKGKLYCNFLLISKIHFNKTSLDVHSTYFLNLIIIHIVKVEYDYLINIK